jgi:hypothetical protein
MTLSDRLDRDITGWRPQPGDKLIGTVTGLTEGTGNWGPYPIVEVEQADGTIVAAHCFHTILRNEIEGRKPAIGDQIGIKYKGKRHGRDQEYEDYTVVVEPGPNHHQAAPAAAIPAPAPVPANGGFDDREPF